MDGITESILNVNGYDDSSDVSYSEEVRLKSIITSNFPHVTIDKIEKLNNKYLYAAFLLKKSENKNYQIKELIHSTAAVNVPSIKKKNLDWRLVQRAKYGYGVSFSENADYANYHSSYAGGDERAFLICDVLIDSIQSVGDNKGIAPGSDIDTFQSLNHYVYVKFDDFVCYPKYVLYYKKPCNSLSKFCRRIINRKRDYRAFIICDVLVGEIWPTADNKNLVPPFCFADTQRSTNGYVYVKFEDFVFYPKYALYFVKPSLTTSRFHKVRTRRRW